MNKFMQGLEHILSKAEMGEPLLKEEILFLLNLKEPSHLERLFKSARAVRERNFGSKIFLYGFVYFSTYCRNNCRFCMYRSSNLDLDRYRKSVDDILETSYRLIESGVHLLDLTMGEDPQYFGNNQAGFEILFRIVERVKAYAGIPLMISPGVVSDEVLREFMNLGVDWYACYQETHNRRLFDKLRIGQSYDERMEQKKQAHKLGLLIEEGLLTGVGDTSEDIVESFKNMKQLEAEQVRVMSFVSQKNTPMHPWPSVSRRHELIIIATMRLLFPDKLIPASLDVDGLGGLAERLKAGANVVTSIIPPKAGLAGVSQCSLDIEEGNRSVSSILPVLEENELTAATRDGYKDWLMARKKLI